jgi:MSHA pilin protein MshA
VPQVAADDLRMRSIFPAGSCPRRNRGFSLIEAVVIVSLVGIVAAFAVPRFTRVANYARASEVVRLSANLRNAAQAAHVRFLASGAHLSAITVEGKTVTLQNGYPDAGPSGIRNAVFDLEGFAVKEGADIVTFIKADAPSGKNCAVTYHAARVASSAASVANVEINGC